MASSQTSTQTQKEMIIDGRIFARSVLVERTANENEDVELMEFIISKVKQQGIYRLVSSHSTVFDKKIVEDFYLNAAMSIFSPNQGGGVREITSSVNGIDICINQALLEKLFKLPSDGLKLEELEGYGTTEFLAAYWSFFVGDRNNKATHVSCHKRNFLLQFVFLHDLFRMMTAIMAGERINWCQVILKRIHEECTKPVTQKKSFGVILHYILEKCGVIPSRSARKVWTGKFIGGSPSSIFNKGSLIANRLFPGMLPLSENPRDVSSKPESKKRKRSSHSKTTIEPAVEKPRKKKLRKLAQSNPTVDHATDTIDATAAQPAQANILQGPTPVEEAPLALITEGTDFVHFGDLQWRQEQEQLFQASMEDNVFAAIKRLAEPSPHYKVSGNRPKFHDPRINWKNSIHCPSAIELPTHRHPTEDEVRKWRKNEVMRYLVKLTRESIILNSCKTLVDAAQQFTKLLEEGNLPLQLSLKRKHQRGEKLTHENDWIMSYDKAADASARYRNKGKEAITKFWKGSPNDPDKRSWRHDNYRR
ncbi:hypothetical protein OROGR_008258 [Orobanche gracilis]